MFRGLNRLVTAAVAVGAVLVVLVSPTAAIACSGGPSAVNVYKECLPTGGGGKPTGGGSSAGSSTPAVSSQTANALRHAGKDKRVLASLVHGYGLHRVLRAGRAGEAGTAPTAFGSAFDLGSGPTALLIVLAGSAALLLGGSGMRAWRTRHRQ